MSWPATQALPRFAAPTSLVTADLSGLAPPEQLTLISLQGIVNRTTPRVYLLADVGEGKTTWMSELGVPHGDPLPLRQVVERFRSEITGAIIPDPAVPQTVSVATTLAGLEDAVITSAATAADLGLPVVEDLRGRFADDLAASTWQIDTLWPRTERRMVCSMKTSLTAYLRDYSIANRALMVWLDYHDPAQRALIERLGDELPTHAPYIGWLRGDTPDVPYESPTVELLSRRSVHVLAADTAQNLTVWGGIRTPVDRTPDRPPTPPLENRIYVTLVFSDGDNLQYAQHKMRQLWDDPARGDIPINWPVPPEILDAAPALHAYFQRTATPNDSLVSGPSGLGYIFPSAYPTATFDGFVARTARYCEALGIDSTVIINRLDSVYEPLTEASVRSYANGMAPAGLFQNWSGWETEQPIVAGVPIGRSRMALNQAELRAGLANAAAEFDAADGTRPVFATIFLAAWDMTPTLAAPVIAELDDRFRAVRGEQFFALVKQAQAQAS
ncbi:GxGYxYP domain-containing protein [Streptomyces sp. SBT349]|uniref:GxGYxYP domain-containing protein n=1 Tax=Streptomyces sp. SBT349 TaxID=1580539 RepID=UPI00066EC19F|nr:GxGYxYP domain-containing protein [Streptomyces sp. SBT349]